MEEPRQQAWLDLARSGDRQALGQILEWFRPYIRTVVGAHADRRLNARLDHSDLIQDVLLVAHRRFEQFRGATVAELAGWLRQIVLGTVANANRAHLGAAKRTVGAEQTGDDVELFLADGSNTPGRLAVRHELAARMAEALSRLPNDMQQVLLGRHMEGLSYAELAQQLDRSEGALRVLYVRAVQRLRETVPE